jgi:branched-chain amino acid transport system substrate-binding protein
MRKNRWISLVTASILTMSVLLSGCGSKGEESDVIYIGTSFPMSGSVAADGKLIVDAIQLAVDEVNASGGIQGKTVELVKEDDEATPTSAAAIANKFVENKDILGVVTSYNSSCCLAQVPIFQEAGLTSISPVATSPTLTGISEYFFRTAPSDAYVGKVGADLCAKLGWESVALLYENDDYGLGISQEFQKQSDVIGLNVATTQTFVYGETVDFGTILTAVADSGADGIFICGLVTETGLICEQKASYGCEDIPVAGANGLYSPAIFEYGDAVDGIYVIGEFSAEDPSEVVQTFVKNYNATYESDPGNWAALAYDAAMVLMTAMKSVEGELTREAVNQAVTDITYEGVAGTYKFENCDSAKEEYYFKSEGGKFVIFE